MKRSIRDLHRKTDEFIIHKVRRTIDEVSPGISYAGSVKQEFEKKVFDLLLAGITPEQRAKIADSGRVNITYLNPVNAVRKTETNTVTIEIVVNDQLVGLLHDRRTELNNSEITSIIFKKIIERERLRLLKLLKG